ncbi:uncharacterized protein G2W53_033920 [Senna tora]|uniref:Uncharacterized protein n=1 Tax=Senna tora TaxID=362788 RepID=A0A834WDB8_9FABA|nr:uncharacterized protein G2W53_033920 [Senna tora]
MRTIHRKRTLDIGMRFLTGAIEAFAAAIIAKIRKK